MLSDSDMVLLRLIAAFEALQIEYMVGGSVASSMLGIPRLTQDVDIVAAIGARDITLLVAELEGDFYVDADLIRAALQAPPENASFNVIYLPLVLKADIFLRQRTPWQSAAWQRRVQRTIRTMTGEKWVSLASPEDMILQKLLWYRLTGERSDRQWLDVQGILKVQRQVVDIVYMKQWAGDLSVADLLDQALADAGIG